MTGQSAPPVMPGPPVQVIPQATARPRILGFDGLRAVAIFMVLGQHLCGAGWISGFPLELGRLGVALFFTLSGYLITGILLDSQGGLARFYWRRTLRIFPAFYVYLGAVTVLVALGLQEARPMALASAATYLINFYSGWRGWSLQHLWSLAVEEQFYLCWPIALRLLGRRVAGLALFGLLAGWPLQRWIRNGHWGHPDMERALFAVTYDCIFWGCLAAILQRSWQPGRGRWPGGGSLLAIPALCVGMLYAGLWAPPVALVPWLRNGSLAWIVVSVAMNQQGLLIRLLETRMMVWLGKRSYSLYLWHLIFMDPRLRSWYPMPVALALGLICAEISYRWVETPILVWRNRHYADTNS